MARCTTCEMMFDSDYNDSHAIAVGEHCDLEDELCKECISENTHMTTKETIDKYEKVLVDKIAGADWVEISSASFQLLINTLLSFSKELQLEKTEKTNDLNEFVDVVNQYIEGKSREIIDDLTKKLAGNESK